MELTVRDDFLGFCYQNSSYQQEPYSEWLRCYGVF